MKKFIKFKYIFSFLLLFVIFASSVSLAADPVIEVDAKIDVTKNNTVYNMLAPLPGITCMDSSGANTLCIGNNIGDYLNIVFKLAIGISAALAVIMLIINGITYMGDESIFKKTKAKSKMFSAVFGLLIALASWALLNTINPALTGAGGLKISTAEVDIEEPPMLQESTGIPAFGVALGTKGLCTVGRGEVTINNKVIMNTCKSISVAVENLIKLAISQKIELSGSSFRSFADQRQARVNNKCPNVLTSPSNACKPPTAIPGTSMHECGRAIDFKCDGQIIKSVDNKCFIFLQKNASSAGL